MAKAQTIATKKYQQKVGLISKSYKIKKTLADEFAEKCKQNGISASKQISMMMQDYINQGDCNSGSVSESDTLWVVYPMFIAEHDGTFLVYVPDMDIYTEGESMVDAVIMARDAIGLKGIDFEDDGKELPDASDYEKATFILHTVFGIGSKICNLKLYC